MARTLKKRQPIQTHFSDDERFGMEHRHTMFWAVLTIIAFPLGLLAADLVTPSAAKAFIAGVMACFAVMFANICADNRIWFFHPKWRETFDHPDFSFKLVVFSGTLLLLAQTLFLVFILFSDFGNIAMLRLVKNRVCIPQSTLMTDTMFCRGLSQSLDSVSK